jgi:3-phosphoglycerate kinase
MRTRDEILADIEKRGGKVLRQDVADLRAVEGAILKHEAKAVVIKHLGRFLRGEKHGKQMLDAVLDDLESYAGKSQN